MHWKENVYTMCVKGSPIGMFQAHVRVLFVGGTRTGRDIGSVSYGRREMVGKWQGNE